MGFLTDLIGDINGQNAQADAANSAAQTISGYAQQGINGSNANYAQIQQLLAPFINAGTSALGQQQNILGMNGTGAQQQAYDAVKASPAFTSAQQLGETSILQNASATGGLRGGNVQSALAQFSPALLAQTLQQQYSNLGGLTGNGLGAAGVEAKAGTGNSDAIAKLLGLQGSAISGGQLASGNAEAKNTSGLFNGIGALAGFF